jgi:Zn finger protein HypA/HybF involved in hydrogenase expression
MSAFDDARDDAEHAVAEFLAERDGALVECESCGEEFRQDANHLEMCPACVEREEQAAEERAELAARRRRLTRQERLEMMADAGCDTWAEYGCER